MNVFTQDARLGRLTTVLGSDALVLLRMDGTEELSGDFEWRVEALSTQKPLISALFLEPIPLLKSIMLRACGPLTGSSAKPSNAVLLRTGFAMI